jgi:hypothetical protein
VLAGWVVGVTGLITAAAVSRIAISEAGSAAAVRAWPGPALAIAGAGLLLAVVAAGDQVPGLLRAGRWRSPAGLAVIGLGAVACTAPALAAAHWVTSGVTGPVRPAAGTLLPEFVAVSSDTGQQLRTLVLQTAPHGGVTYLVLRDSDPLIGSQELALPTAAEQALSRSVATLTASSGSAVTDQGRALAGFGIGYVLLPAPVNAGLARLLDDVPGLRPVSATSDFQLWRVVGTTARVTVTESGGTVVPVSSGPVSVTAARAPSAGGTLMLAEPAGGWSATLNGHPLTPLAAPVNGWAQGFRLPAGGGSLSVSHSDFGRAALLGLEGLAVLVAIGLALPGPRAAAEAELEEPAQGDDALGAQEPGRRRASHGREPEERSRRRRTPRRGQNEPQLPPGTEVPRPAIPAQALGRRAAAVPAGIQAGRARRGGPPGAEDPYSGDEAQQGGPSYPGGDPFPGDSFPGDSSRPGDPGYPGSPVPAQPAPGAPRLGGLFSETYRYRAPNGGTTGRHSHRAGAGPGRARSHRPGRRPPRGFPGRPAGPGRGAGRAPHQARMRPGRGVTRLGPATTGLPPREGQNAPRGPASGPRRWHGLRAARRPGRPSGGGAVQPAAVAPQKRVAARRRAAGRPRGTGALLPAHPARLRRPGPDRPVRPFRARLGAGGAGRTRAACHPRRWSIRQRRPPGRRLSGPGSPERPLPQRFL